MPPVRRRLTSVAGPGVVGVGVLGSSSGPGADPVPVPCREGVVGVAGAATSDATPTASHPALTAATTSESAPWRAVAAATVSRAKVAKSQSALMSPVMVSTQTWPATSQALPPRVVATTWNALLGMPELMCTPPLSSVVST